MPCIIVMIKFYSFCSKYISTYVPILGITVMKILIFYTTNFDILYYVHIGCYSELRLLLLVPAKS